MVGIYGSNLLNVADVLRELLPTERLEDVTLGSVFLLEDGAGFAREAEPRTAFVFPPRAAGWEVRANEFVFEPFGLRFSLAGFCLVAGVETCAVTSLGTDVLCLARLVVDFRDLVTLAFGVVFPLTTDVSRVRGFD